MNTVSGDGKKPGKHHIFDVSWYSLPRHCGDYGARFYNPVIARFTTVDPYAENYYHASPFAYVGNNPISRIDPDGRDWYENTKGARVWYEGSGEREGYTRSTQDFSVSAGGNTSYTYSPTQQAPVSETETVLDPSAHKQQPRGSKLCYDKAVESAKQGGFNPEGDQKTGIQVGVEQKKNGGGHEVVAHKDAQNGLAYMDRLIDQGIAPVVGADHSFGLNINDKTSDHYMAISSRTTNLSTGEKSYRFLDPGSSRGKNPEFQFTRGAKGMYQSKSTYDVTGNLTYTLSYVVKHKPK